MLLRENLEQIIPANSAAYDVIVAGGGPAGLGAAMASAKTGARTLLLEARSFLGGVAPIALWMPVNRLLLDGGSRGGVHNLFVDKIKKYGAVASIEARVSLLCGDGLDIHPEFFKLACFEALEETGCHYRLYSPVTDVLMEGNRVKGVVVTCKDGRQEFSANVIVDATGDGDVAYLSGAQMVKGREEDGQFMPVSLVFAVSNVDVERFFEIDPNDRKKFNVLMKEAAQNGYHIAMGYSFDKTTVPGVVSVNNWGPIQIGNVDGSKVQELTMSERMGLQVAIDFVRVAREKKIPGLENCFLIRTGACVGVRDTRRILGEYIQTVEDARNGVEFEDVVARKYGAIDANNIFVGEMASGFAYPYRSMLPRKIDNLLVAGRCGSATFLGHAAGKSMGNMMALGQAAGVAAALSSEKNIAPRNLDIKILQSKLRSMGVKL